MREERNSSRSRVPPDPPCGCFTAFLPFEVGEGSCREGKLSTGWSRAWTLPDMPLRPYRGTR